ncbi:AAA family ATPase [Bosea sp. BIWAKO-01]|uniref:AAA family ATPase n=1 Tax=Bosea sp. BIWAKO-01 TaxID=506668 RepID=UPI00159EFED5|nr:AAA family ATPase [Bosea sp. BIWAKO-01]
MTATQPEFAPDDEGDYPPTGLEHFKGPIAEPPGWDPETDETPDATPESDEFYTRRQLGLEAYDAARFERFHEERCADRTARQAEIKAALQAFRTGGVTPANDNLPAMARAHPIGQDAKFALSVGRGKGPRDIATARDYISGYIEDAYKALLAGDLNGACENLAKRYSMARWIQQHGGGSSEGPKPVSATPFVWIDPKTIPRREWLYGSHYARKYLSATFGAGGGGKTAHSYTEALAMASGKPLLGEIPRERRRVWTINLEDPIEEIDRRVMAAALHYSLRPDDIEGYLWTDSGREQQFVVVRTEGRDIKVVEPVVAALIAEIKERQIDVLIVDPFVSTHSVPENDNGAIQAVAAAWVRVAHEANCSVELVHHVRKSNGQEATADDGRGAGALKDKARSVRVVNGMTKEEAEKAGIPADQARRYFRVDFGKVNMVASSSSAWRRFASVSLGNGAGMLDPADQIGVVESWRWPSAQDIAGDVPEHLVAAVVSRLGSREAREHDQANGWAGYIVAEVLGLDADHKSDRARIKTLLAAWLKQGLLKIETRPDHQRRDRKYIVPAAPPPHWIGGAEVEQGGATSPSEPCSTTPRPRKGVGVEQGEKEEITGGAGGGANPPDEDADFTPPAFIQKSAPSAIHSNGAPR